MPFDSPHLIPSHPIPHNMDKWRGKVAVVTGASSGIGAEVALALANAGLIVVGLARREDRIQVSQKCSSRLNYHSRNNATYLHRQELSSRVTGQGRLHAMKCDVTSEAELSAAFASIRTQFSTVHILVNNAGMMSSGFLIGKQLEAAVQSVMGTEVPPEIH